MKKKLATLLLAWKAWKSYKRKQRQEQQYKVGD